jgi:hypothetical protein
VLQTLADADPGIATAASQIADGILGEVSCEQVARDVQDAIRCLDLDDLDAGPTPLGYTEPADVVWEVLDATIAPFIGDLKRRVELDREREALEICKGIVLGLYDLRDEAEHEVLMHAPDFPQHAAAQVIDVWRRSRKTAGRKTLRRNRPEFPIAFVSDRAPEWSAFVRRLVQRR